jgi:preprotein translocase subunit SecY
MSNVIANIFRVAEIRNKVLFTLSILVLYRIGAHIPIPGINVVALQAFFENASQGAAGGFINFFDLFAGGALKRFTVFALGIMPYISASIIFQLLQVIVPSIEKMAKEGPEGRKKINKYTRYLTVFLCIIQSSSISVVIKNVNVTGYGSIVETNSDIAFYVLTALTITTGTMTLLWLGELITEHGIGNGVSLLIFAGIIVQFPAAVVETSRRIISRSEPIAFIMLATVFLAVIAGAIMLTLGRRNIPLQFGKRSGGAKGAAQTLPIPVNAGNVMPIIFGVAIMQLPQMLSQMNVQNDILNRVMFYMSPGQIPYMAIYAILILFFAFFYASIVFNTEEVSKNLKKNQGYIPGIRPGTATAEYLTKVLNRVTLTGAIGLAVIAITPDLILKLFPEEVSPSMAYLFGGTSLMIIVGVALDTLKQIESQLKMRHYDGFFKKGKLRSRR